MRKIPLILEIARRKGEKSFPLVLYYTLASIVVIAIAAFVVNYIFTEIEFERLLQVTERRANQEANHLNTIISFQPTLQESHDSRLSLQRLSDESVMDSIVLHPSMPANIAFFSVLNHGRKILYSTIPGIRGTIHKQHPGFESTRVGQISTDLVDMPMEDGRIVKLFEIYRPIYAKLYDKKNPIGVLKTYHYLEEPGKVFVLGTTRKKIMATIATMGSLFLALLGIVIHGQRVINRSYFHLEVQVAERTEELSKANEKLKAEIAERKQAEKALVESKFYLENIITSMTDALFVIGTDDIIQTVNTATTTILGYTEEKLTGMSVGKLFDKEEEVFSKYVLSIVEWKLQAVYDRDTEDFWSLLKTAHLGIVVVGSDGKIVMVNEQTESVFGYGKGALAGEMIHVLLPANLRDVHEKVRGEFMASPSPRFMGKERILKAQRKDGTTFEVEVGLVPLQIDGDTHVVSVIRDPAGKERWEFIKHTRFGRLFTDEEVFWNVDRTLVAKNGKKIPVLMSGAVMRDKSGEIHGAVLVAKDITERKQAEEEVYQSREQLRALAARLHSIREEEQMRISRELHDVMGHLLTALKIDLIALSKDPLIKNKPQADDLQSMISLTEESLQTIKRISTELRPGVLDQLGLGAAIEWELEDFEKHNGVKCKTLLSKDLSGLNKEKQVTLFRILQEALTNISRHAGATNVKVTLKRSQEMMSLTVQDDGQGFKPSKVDSIKSLGLLGMHERAYSVGGELVLSSQPDVGTKITASIPLD
ncbi:MAG: PAS domain S-box protein [Candidatus Marinimicrobia bacterium]|nr:PAS domain S-box protein [Candidatus Neomarinimicrobiota bacterium]